DCLKSPTFQLHPSEEDEDLQDCESVGNSNFIPPSQTLTSLNGHFLSWNCRRHSSKLQDLKGLINYFLLFCIGLPGNILVVITLSNYIGYNSVRRDAATGAVAVQFTTRTLVTVCSVYLPPHDDIRPTGP
ncbi:hypothetical protein AVEN_18106-1, partial [Araneus ventricosus]